MYEYITWGELIYTQVVIKKSKNIERYKFENGININYSSNDFITITGKKKNL